MVPEKHASSIRRVVESAIEQRHGRPAKAYEVRVVEDAVAQALSLYRDDVNAELTEGYPLERVRREVDHVEHELEALTRSVMGLSREARQILGLGGRMRNIGVYAPAALVAKWCDHPEGPPSPAPARRSLEDDLRGLWLRAGRARKSLKTFAPRSGRPLDFAARTLAFRCAIIWADLTRVPLGRHIDGPGPFADFAAAVFEAAGMPGRERSYCRELARDLENEESSGSPV